MKKNIITALIILLSTTAFASGGEIDRLDKKTVKTMTEEQMHERAFELEERLEEIHAINLNDLTRAEKKAVKSEVKYIQREAKALGNGGVYISVSTLLVILIVILLV
jgi:hypothetical protein